MKNIKSQRGFILLVAIIACAILAALGVLVFTLSTGDLRTSAATLGEKRASAAVESGFHLLTLPFNPILKPPPSTYCNLDANYLIYNNAWHRWAPIDAVNAPGDQLYISSCAHGRFGPITAGGTDLGRGYPVYDIEFSGRNTTYNSAITVDVGVGYSPSGLPVDITPGYQ